MKMLTFYGTGPSGPGGDDANARRSGPWPRCEGLRTRIATLAITLSLVAGLSAAEPVAESVMSVDAVRFEVDRAHPKALVVVAHGTVPSGGWMDAKLRARSYEAAPDDGILDVDFVATRPTLMATQALSPVTAQLSVPVDSWVRGVRVHARTNSMESTIASGTGS